MSHTLREKRGWVSFETAMKKLHAVFDCELIGTHDPIFLVCVSFVELKKRAAFWWHRDGDMAKLATLLANKNITWVGFNSIRFDAPLIAAALAGLEPVVLKEIAQKLIEPPNEGGMMPWVAARSYGFERLDIDHIDLFNTAPGVNVSLKRYMGRMGYKSMIDMPFHHTKDLTPDEHPTVERYCFNDVGGTKELFSRLQTEIRLRETMSAEYGVDMRSKSDAQIAEAIFKVRLEIKRNNGVVPPFVEYRAPGLIKTDNPAILALIERLENERFAVNLNSGRPQKADWMRGDADDATDGEGFRLGQGTYTIGLGGLHSSHDVKLYAQAGNGRRISDFDVASYYPNIIMKVGLVPNFGGLKGVQFLDAYAHIYDLRLAAKRGAQEISRRISELKKMLAECDE